MLQVCIRTCSAGCKMVLQLASNNRCEEDCEKKKKEETQSQIGS